MFNKNINVSQMTEWKQLLVAWHFDYFRSQNKAKNRDFL